VPTIADRVAQTVVARRLEAKVEPIFEVVPGLVELEVAVPRLRPAVW
jgi:hypothetical protein